MKLFPSGHIPTNNNRSGLDAVQVKGCDMSHNAMKAAMAGVLEVERRWMDV